MKKIALLLTAVLIFSACKSQTGQVTAPDSQTEAQAINEFTEMGKALQAGKSVSCSMKKKDSPETVTYTIKGKKMKMSGFAADSNQQGSMLSDGEYVYTWNDTTKEGTKFKLPTEEELKDTAEKTGQTQQSVPDFSDEAERQKYADMGYTVNCEVANVSDSDFVPPADVTFRDMSQIMEAAKQYQQSSAQPSASDQAEMQRQAQELMKQYAQ